MNTPLTNGQITKDILLSILMIALLSTSAGASAFAGGDGSAGNPYQISTVEQLQLMNSSLSAHYILVNDIDASGTTSWNWCAGFEPVGDYSNKFTGSLGGQGYNITGLYINRSSETHVGLFGSTDSSCKIENVSLINCNVTGEDRTGGLVGENDGILTQCYVTGNVTGNVTGIYYYVGGLVGDNDGTLTQCYATGNVTGNYYVGGLVGENDGTLTQCYATGNVTGNYFVGGLVGENYGTLTQCYATGNVTGNGDSGGLVGDNYGTLTQCYATGNVTGVNTGGLVGVDYGTLTQCYATGNVTGVNTGGLVGVDYGSSGSLTQCYWDSETTGQSTSDGSDSSYGKETGEMKTQSTFVGWDFDNVWTFCDETTAS